MLAIHLALIFLTGLCTGVFGALLGIGGGVFLIPVLVLLLHTEMYTAVAASLLSVVATSSAAASVYLKNRLTNVRLGMTLEMATTAGGIVGGLIAVHVGEKVLQLLFAAIMIVTAIAMWKRPHEQTMPADHPQGHLGGEYFDRKLQHVVRYSVEHLPFGLGISLIAGGLSGLLGIGGGVIKVPALVLVMRVPLRAATATSDFMIGVTALASAYIYYSRGQMDLLVAGPASMGTFLGSLVGAHFGARLHSKVLSIIFAVVLALTALEMLLRGLGKL